MGDIMNIIKKGIYSGLRGIGHFTNGIISGAKAGGFTEGFKAGVNASGYGVSKAIWDTNYNNSLLSANRRSCGLDPETGAMLEDTQIYFIVTAIKILEQHNNINNESISKETKQRKKDILSEKLPTITSFANKSIECESRYLSGNHQKVMKKYIKEKGKKIQLEKAKNIKNAMGSILANLGNSLMYSNDFSTGQYLVNLSQGIINDYGSINLTNIFTLVCSKLTSEQLNQYLETIKTLRNNQYAFNDINISLSINYSGLDISTSSNLTSEISTAEISYGEAENLYNSVKEASSEKEKSAMARVEASCTTLYSKVPEYSLGIEALNNKKRNHMHYDL